MPTVEQIRKLAAELKLEPALVQAVCLVEASGSGFLPPGAKSPAGRVVAGLFKIPLEPRITPPVNPLNFSFAATLRPY